MSKYSLVNAKVRARLSRLLEPGRIERLAESRDLAEFYSALSGTIYEDIFSRPEIAFDPRVGERLLIEREIEWHSELLNDLKGAEKELVFHFLQKYEIENLKAALRIREGSRDIEEMKYMVQRRLPNALPYRQIAEAASLVEGVSFLEGTPYRDAVLAVLDDYEEKRTLFPVEINLEVDYYKRLLDSGMSTLYLQFDGLREEIDRRLRGRVMLPVRKKVIENAKKLGHKSIVLVVTLAKGVNDTDLGNIVDFAIKNSDVVRCVNIQPISMAGRARKEEMRKLRITIPDAIKLIEEQTGGKVSRWDWRPVNWPVPISKGMELLKGRMYPEFTMHPHCGAATFLVVDKGDYRPITEYVDVDRFAEIFWNVYYLGVKGKKTRAKLELTKLLSFVKSELIRNLIKGIITKGSYEALGELMHRVVMLGIMHFQDVWNLDLDRTNRCAIHYATPDMKVRSFCTYNTIYRQEVEKGFAIPLKEWMEKTGKKLSDYN